MNKRILTLFLSLTLLLSLAACGGNVDTTDARRDANEIVRRHRAGPGKQP